MSKRTVFTSITPLPAGLTREMVVEFLHNHIEMIDLNPLVEERKKMEKPPPEASAEEYHCTWYSLTDKIQYIPGTGKAGSGRITYSACFHDLPLGLQTHVMAPLGVDIKEVWSVGGTLPGEPKQPVQIGLNIPKDGLYLREDVDLKCNFMTTSFVKKNLKRSHKVLVDRLVEKGKLVAVNISNAQLAHDRHSMQIGMPGGSSPGFAPPGYGTPPHGSHTDISRSSTVSSHYPSYQLSDISRSSTVSSHHDWKPPMHLDPYGHPAQGPYGNPLSPPMHPYYQYQGAPQNMGPHGYGPQYPAQNTFAAELPAEVVMGDQKGQAPTSSPPSRNASWRSHSPQPGQHPAPQKQFAPSELPS